MSAYLSGAVGSSAGSDRYNSTHAEIRCLGEQAVAVLKGRRLLRKLRCGANRITSMVKAVVVLHHAST